MSTSVAKYYNSGTGWTQCAVANNELGRNNCCAGNANKPCNVYSTLDTSLSRIGHLDHMAGKTATFNVVTNQIAESRPVSVRTA